MQKTASGSNSTEIRILMDSLTAGNETLKESQRSKDTGFFNFTLVSKHLTKQIIIVKAFVCGWNLPDTLNPWSHPPNQVSWSWLKSRWAPQWYQRGTMFSSAGKKQQRRSATATNSTLWTSPEVLKCTKLGEMSRFIDDWPVETCGFPLPCLFARTCYNQRFQRALSLSIFQATTLCAPRPSISQYWKLSPNLGY